MQALLITNPSPKYNENVLPLAATLNNPDFPITVQSGAGGSTAFYWEPKKLIGDYAIESLNYSKTTPLIWNLGDALNFQVPGGIYILQIQLNPELDPNFPPKFNVRIFENGTFVNKVMECILGDAETGFSLTPFNYHTFAASFNLSPSVTYSMGFEHIANPDTNAEYSAIFVTGLKLEKDIVANGGIPTAYSKSII